MPAPQSRATSKVSALPPDVNTFAEVLHDGGYYTRGFSNNPNITSLFNYNQGFVDYTDLKPNLYFGITAGNMDSMVNRYTADRKIRSADAYTPHAAAGKRPDRAVGRSFALASNGS